MKKRKRESCSICDKNIVIWQILGNALTHFMKHPRVRLGQIEKKKREDREERMQWRYEERRREKSVLI